MGQERNPLDRNPYGDATAANTAAGWATGGTPVDVDLDGLREYAGHMADEQRDLMGRSTHLSHLAQMPSQAWGTLVLGEAAHLRSQLQANAQELQTYVQMLGQTLFNIGSAAQTVADSYQSADGTSAATLNSVLFAFGDKSVPRPSGLPPGVGQTYSEAMAAAAGTEAPPADSPQWGRSTESVVSPYQTMLTATAPGGERREEVTTSVPGSGMTVITTTVYAADGHVVSTSSIRRTTTFDPATNTRTVSEETTSGGRPTGRSETTTTYDGSEVVREQSVSYSTDQQGAEREGATRTETVADDGTSTRVVTRPGEDGSDEVVDRVVVGAETEGIAKPRPSLALANDPLAPGNR